MGRKRKNNVYRHYLLQEENQTSTCLLCYKTLHTVHGSNLMHHLKYMHKIEYQKVVALNKGTISPKAIPPSISPNSNDEDSNQSEPEVEVDVEKFFTVNRVSNRARCEICQATVDASGNNMMNHLKGVHPQMLKPANDDSDADDPNDLFQEVVYLYDSDSKSPNSARPKLGTPNPIGTQNHKAKRKMRQSTRPSISLENRKRRRTQDTPTNPPDAVDQSSEELENFGKYVTCLMKTVPEDVCTQLQMDIINLIMTAKLKNRSKSEARTSIIEKTDSVSAGPNGDKPIMGSVDASKSDNSINDALPSPESNVDEIYKTEDG